MTSVLPSRWRRAPSVALGHSICVALLFSACGGPSVGATDGSAGGAGAAPAEGSPGASAPSATTGLPAHAPERFGFGVEATRDRIAAWDIDVRPDGEGLPPGAGSVAEGRDVYMTHCVACHGPTGTEGPNDRLVNTEQWDAYPTGRAVGNYWPHATTLFDYIRKAMPQLTPGILSDDEVYAVIAFVLHLNGIVPEDAVLDAESLAGIEMPARDRFVVDDRVGGPGPMR